MGLIGKLKQGAGLLSDHPALAGWFVRNKLRTATLSLERNHMEGVSRFARGVTFRLTNACNLRCKMCRFVESGDVKSNIRESLPPDAWIDVIEDLALYRPYITLTGGEPLIYPNIGELVRRITGHNMRCTITTNGTLLAGCASDHHAGSAGHNGGVGGRTSRSAQRGARAAGRFRERRPKGSPRSTKHEKSRE